MYKKANGNEYGKKFFADEEIRSDEQERQDNMKETDGKVCRKKFLADEEVRNDEKKEGIL